MEIRITAEELRDRGVWEDTCKLLDLSNNIDDDQMIILTEEQAKQINLISCDEVIDDEATYRDMCLPVTIRFLQAVTLQVICECTNDEPNYVFTKFEEGQTLECILIGEHIDSYDLQTPDGDGLFGISKNIIVLEHVDGPEEDGD